MSYALVRQAIIEKKAIHATYSGVYNHSTVFGQNSMPGRQPYLRATADLGQLDFHVPLKPKAGLNGAPGHSKI